MAVEHEIERMVVRLVGDGAQFVKMMKDAAGVTTKATTQMITALNRLEGFANTLLGTFGSLGIASSLKGAFDQFAKMELGQIRLNAAITAGGHDADVLGRRYKEVAESLASMTLNTKGEVLALFQKAEVMGFSGDQAERVVRNSIALAAATGNEAASMIRGVAASERGNLSLLRRQLQLQGVKDETELVTKINQRMAMGMAVATAEFNSASGKMERLGRSLKSVGTEVGGLIASYLLPAANFVQKLTEQFKLLDDETKKLTYKVVGLTLAWMGMGPVTSVLKGLLSPITGLIRYLVITLPLTLVNAAAWALWKTILVAWSVAAGVVYGVATVLYVALQLLVAGLTVSASLFAVLASSMAALGIFAVVAGFKFLMSAVPAVLSGIGNIYSLLSGVGSFLAPLASVGEVLRGWVDIIKEVVQAAQTDLPAAWRLATAGFNLALNQLKDMWPPIWNYISAGFSILFNSLKDELSDIVAGMVQRLRIAIANPANINGWSTNRLRQLEEAQEAISRNRQIIAQSRLNALRLGGSSPSTGTNLAQTEVDAARQNIEDIANMTEPAAEQAGLAIGAAMNKGMKSELQKFDAVEFGSAEALARISEYTARLVNPSGRGGTHGAVDEEGHSVGSPVPSAPSSGLAGGSASGNSTVVALLTRIAGGIDRIAGMRGGSGATANFEGV